MNTILLYKGMADEKLDGLSSSIIKTFCLTCKQLTFVDKGNLPSVKDQVDGILIIGTPTKEIFSLAKALNIPLFCTGTVQTREELIDNSGIRFYRWWISANDQTYLVARRMIGEIKKYLERTPGQPCRDGVIVKFFYPESQSIMNDAFCRHFENLFPVIIPNVEHELRCHSYTRLFNTSMLDIPGNGDFVYVTGYGDNYEAILESSINNSAVTFTDIALPILYGKETDKSEIVFPSKFQHVRYLSLFRDTNSLNLFKVFIQFTLDRIRDCFSEGIFNDKGLDKGMYELDEGDLIVLRQGGFVAPCLVGKYVDESGRPVIDKQWLNGVENLVSKLSPQKQVNLLKFTEMLVDRCAEINAMDIADSRINIWKELRNLLFGSFPDISHVMFFAGDKVLFSDKTFEGTSWPKTLLSISSDKPVQINLREYDLCDNDSYRLFLWIPDDIVPLKSFHSVAYCYSSDKSYPIIAASSEEDANFLFHNSSESSLAELQKCGDEFASWVTKNVLENERWMYIVPEATDYFNKGYVVFVSHKKLDLIALQLVTNSINRVYEGVRTVIATKQLKMASTKSAIGSIMSRNGSHNIGSHVLSALSHNVGTMPDDRVLYQYIQHRMDYIASATTGAPDWSVPTPFVGNLMKMFYSQHHLLEHIAESDGLHAYLYQGKGTQFGEGQNNCVKIVVRRISHTSKEGWNHKKVFGKDVWMYSFFHEDAAKKVETDTNGERIMSDVTDKPVVWKNDEDVSVPGGILGQHAFYNIVENVIRNAAKHSWAGKSEAERGAQNLEIYVDFEKDIDDKTMCFTVGDNMSRLFCEDFWNDAFRYLASSENSIKLPQGFSSWPEVFAQPLDGFIVPSNAEASNREKVKDFLDGEGNLDDLPPQYKALCDYIVKKWDALKSKESFKAILKGSPDKNEDDVEIDGLGHRLPLPLHHRQELALAEPFIDLETNQLRQSAWGLSEMKISAGYLRRADVSVIGGLEQPKPGEHPLIVPLGIPRGKAKDDKEAKWQDFCLAYRFWVKLPKDVLIVADDTGKWGRITGQDEWEGIEVKSFDEVLGPKGVVGKMSDYSFVILDHIGDIGEKEQLELPFRALSTTATAGLPCVQNSELYNARTRQELVECVYSSWLDYLKHRRYGKDEHKDLTIKLKISEKKGGERGLVSDRDIYKVLFRECLHSVLEPLVNKKDKNLTEPQRQAILLVSLYPVDETDEMFEKVEEQFKSEGEYPNATKKLLGEIADRVRSVLNAELDVPNRPSRDKVFRAWRAGLGNPAKNLPGDIIAPLLEIVRDDTHSTPVPSGILDVLFGMRKSSRPSEALFGSHSQALDVAMRAMETARATSEVFLRKYEERITTLPRQYRGIGLPEEETLPFGSFGVSVTYAEKKADISYLRHSVDDAELYSEPLSGSQSYLNALSSLSRADSQWAMRLAENGLLRIVVIDERVCKFIADHGKEIKKTYESMRIAVVDTEKKPELGTGVSPLPDFTDCEQWKFVAGNPTDPRFGRDFDLVIIHQGIIDKWWPNNHNKTDVATILNAFRKPQGSGLSRFVVVTTGRGRPDNIPETAKVLAFSSIEFSLFKRYPEKMCLVNSLMNILPGSPERNYGNG